jgi:uncharacterized damage-inducible protein DinB
MNNQLKLANRFREVILNGTWIANTNFKNELSKINWKIAIKKSENLNSIAALAQHIHYYIKGIKNVFLGGRLEISDKYSFDFPEIQSEQEWLNFLVEFWKDSEELALLIETMEETKLNAYFVDEKYGSYYRNIDAMIEHSYYHLGQIVLINKILN